MTDIYTVLTKTGERKDANYPCEDGLRLKKFRKKWQECKSTDVMANELFSCQIDNCKEFEGLKSIIAGMVELVESSNWEVLGRTSLKVAINTREISRRLG
jgi:hypothetical protein